MTYAPDHALIATPIGAVEIWGDDRAITRISIPTPGMQTSPDEHAGTHAAVREATAQLRAYFAGKLRSFDLPLEPVGSVRGEALRTGIASIGYGDALSYGALARLLDSGPRAVGQACARNPYAIVIPCHRVLAAGRKLGAYTAGEGPATKRWLRGAGLSSRNGRDRPERGAGEEDCAARGGATGKRSDAAQRLSPGDREAAGGIWRTGAFLVGHDARASFPPRSYLCTKFRSVSAVAATESGP